MRIARFIISLGISLAAAFLLFWFLENPLFDFHPFSKPIINFYLNYEMSTLLVSLSLLIGLFFVSDNVRLKFLSISKVSSPMKPSLLPGLRKEERWETTGWTIGLIMAAVTGLVLYFQTSASGYSFKLRPNLIMVLPMAAANAFTEEVVFRLSYVTATENAGLLPTWAKALGSLVFGFIHYWGIAPKGMLGAVLAAYIGFFLTKSILETKGFLFAWAVHAILDVVILTFLFNAHP